jgi:hypothetical protein
MFADATVYLTALYAVGQGVGRKAKSALMGGV